MPTINVTFEPHEWEELEAKRGENTWKEFILDSAMRLKKRQVVTRNGDSFVVRDVTDAEMRNLGGKKEIAIPVNPDQIMVYTIYTLEKVE